MIPSPNPPCRFNHELKLPALVFGRNAVPYNRGGESALWTDSQPFQRNIAARLGYAASDRLERFQLGRLGCNQSQHDKFIIRHVFERRKRTGALIVIFQKKTLRL